MREVKIIIRYILIVAVIGFIFLKLLPALSSASYGCNLYHDLYDEQMDGVVTRKFVDKENHNYPSIYIKRELMTFTPKLGDLYEYLNVGDSIIKKQSSLLYRVISKKTGKDTVFKFETTCKDTLK